MSIQAYIISEISKIKIMFQIKISIQLKSKLKILFYMNLFFLRPLSIEEKDDIILE
jgi:hypothetical protein